MSITFLKQNFEGRHLTLWYNDVMRILLADPSERMLSVLNYALKAEPNVQVVGEVTNTASLSARATELLPDLVLLDWQLAGMDAQALIQSLHQVRPQLKVIAMVTHFEDGRSALAARADAIVSKGDPPNWLLTTIRRLVTKPGTESTENDP